MAKIPVSTWQQDQITERVAAKFREAGVDPAHLSRDWTLDGDGYLKATAIVRMTPEEATALINGPRE